MNYNFKTLLINGCSHSAGSEIGYAAKAELAASNMSEDEFNKKNSFGSQLAIKLGVNCINLAQPGGSNEHIANSTMLWCLSNPEEVKNTFFLIHWTASARIDFFVNSCNGNKPLDWVFDEKYGHVHANHFWPYFDQSDVPNIKVLSKHLFINPVHWEVNRLLCIIRTQALLNSMGAKFKFYNAFNPLTEGKRYKKYHKLINKTTFHEPFNQDQSFYYWAINQGHDIKGQLFWHHKLPAHTEYANKLLAELFL